MPYIYMNDKIDRAFKFIILTPTKFLAYIKETWHCKSYTYTCTELLMQVMFELTDAWTHSFIYLATTPLHYVNVTADQFKSYGCFYNSKLIQQNLMAPMYSHGKTQESLQLTKTTV